MHDAATSEPTDDAVASALPIMRELYAKSRYLAANAHLQSLPAPETWLAAEPMVFAARLIANLGATRRSTALVLRADRLSRRRCPEAALFRGYDVLQRHGPYAAWRYLRHRPPPLDADRKTRSSWLALEGRVSALFRDFETAEARWRQAWEITDEPSWLLVERSEILEAQDRYEEALVAAREALVTRPWFRPALHAEAQMLSLLSRDAEAVDRLAAALANTESGSLAGHRAELLIELGRPTEALADLASAENLSPLREPTYDTWLAARRAEAHYLLGDYARAAEFSEKVEQPWHRDLAQRLRAEPPAGQHRVQLDVPFVRQHTYTCAPATLSALTQFFGRPVAQEVITAEICYDGTRPDDEREWLRRNSWVTREFRVDWESTKLLIDSNIPFALATTSALQGHLQAVTGYDEFRRTVIIRDPFERAQREWDEKDFFARFAAAGPRGLALIHGEDEVRLKILLTATLPDAREYDELHALRLALRRHNRTEAERCAAEITRLAPDGLLDRQTRRELAWYDRDDPTELALVESMLEKYPNDGRLRVAKLYALQRLARGPEVEEWLNRCAHEPVGDQTQLDATLVFWREMAVSLTGDERMAVKARHWILRALHKQPTDGQNLVTVAHWHWGRGDFEEALAHYRLAATVRVHDENLWRNFFAASQHFGRGDEVVALLEQRFGSLGASSSNPARTLVGILNERNQSERAASVLADAIKLRPNDPELLLFAAEHFARIGEHARAGTLLETARSLAAPNAWRRAAAVVADYRGDLCAALKRWQQLLEAEPLDEAANRAVARLLAETSPDGPAAAITHLRVALTRYPHSGPLHVSLCEWLARSGKAGEREAALRTFLEVQPNSAWTQRELALALLAESRPGDALVALSEAARMEPRSCVVHAIRAEVHLALGDRLACQDDCRRSLALNADHVAAMRTLIHAARGTDETRDALQFVEGELLRQVTHGDGIMTFRELAQALMPPEELLASLQRAFVARPDLWQTWSALASQLATMKRLDEARDICARGTARFPLVPRLWVELADIEGLRKQHEGEIEALHHALSVNSAYGYASRTLCRALRLADQTSESERVIDAAIAAAPLDSLNYFTRSEMRWSAGRPDEALADLERAIQLNPPEQLNWRTLAHLSARVGDPGRAGRLATALSESRPGDADIWYMRAAIPSHGLASVERLAAIRRAIELRPQFIEAHDLHATHLAEHGQYAEAMVATEPAAWKPGEIPRELRGRRAWLHMHRGDRPTARAEMRKVVVDFPTYEWGWQCMAEWADAMQDRTAVLEAAQQLARIAPGDATPLGFLADAKVALDDRVGAKADLREALRRLPTYAWAGRRLLDLELEDGDLAAADRVLAHLIKHFGAGDPRATFAELCIACARRQRDQADDALRSLFRCPPTENSLLGDGVEAFSRVFTTRVAEDLCYRALGDPEVNPITAAHWAHLRASRRPRFGISSALDHLTPGPARVEALTSVVNEMGEQRAGICLRVLLWKFGDELRASTQAWGTAAFGLTNCGRMQATADWGRDWQKRAEAVPWMLWNISLSNRGIGDDATAARVTAHAVSLPPDHTTSTHLGWFALDSALNGTSAETNKAIARAHELSTGDNAAQFARRLAEILRDFSCAAPAEMEAATTEARRQIGAAYSTPGTNLKYDRVCQRARWRALRFVAAASGRTADRLRAALARPAPFWLSGSSPPWTMFSGKGWYLLLLLLISIQALRACATR